MAGTFIKEMGRCVGMSRAVKGERALWRKREGKKEM